LYQQTYYVTKISGTYSDILMAVGLARILQKLLMCEPNEITISNKGNFFAITCPRSVVKDNLNNKTLVYLPYIISKEGEKSPVSYSFSLPESRERRKVYWEKRKVKDKDYKIYTPPNMLEVAECLQSLKAISTFNNIAMYTQEESKIGKPTYQCILQACSLSQNNWEEAEKVFKNAAKRLNTKFPSCKALQIINPEKGKGVNATKQGKIRPDQISSFWIVEYLKYVGLVECGICKRILVGNRKYDKKIYIAEPTDISLYHVSDALSRFKDKFPAPTPVKIDIAAILNYTEQLLNYFLEEDDIFSFGDMSINNIVQGFQMAHFKNLGPADSLSNLTFLGLPTWIVIPQQDKDKTIRKYLSIIDEHKNIIISSLEEDGQTEYAMQRYRDFLSAGDLNGLLDFLLDYSIILMQQLTVDFAKRKYKYVRPFEINNLKEVVKQVNKKYSKIVENNGFQRIADAIRASTVSLQYKDKKDRKYEVRYGLAQDIKRVAPHAEQFLSYISDFIASYNAESARMYERYKEKIKTKQVKLPYRPEVTPDDIVELVKLVDEFGSDIVAKLLVAIGYSGRSYEKKNENGGKIND